MKVRHREGGDGGREGTVGRGVGGREEGEGRKQILPGGGRIDRMY